MAIRYPRGSADVAVDTAQAKKLMLGHGETLTAGNGVQIVSIGPIAEQVASAVDKARSEGLDVAHHDAIFLKPLDDELMHKIAATDSTVVTVEDGTVEGGLGTAVTDLQNEHGYERKVVKIGVPDRFIYHGTVPELYKMCGMDSESIYAVIKSES